MKIRIVLFLAAVGVALPLRGADEVRHVFTDTQGRKIEADVVRVEGESVRVKKADGQEALLPLVKLSVEDVAFMKEWIAQHGDVKLDAQFTKKKTAGRDLSKPGVKTADDRKSGNSTMNIETRNSEEDWRFEVQITNRSGRDLTKLRVDYMQFSEIEDSVKGAGGNSDRKDPVTVRGTAQIESLPHLKSTTFQTQIQTLPQKKSMVKTTTAPSSRNSPGQTNITVSETKGQLDSVWIRVFNEQGRMVFESKSPGNLARKSEWKDE